MQVLLDDSRVTLLHGDCSDLGSVLPENSVDAIVTDPPGGISMNGSKWDGDKGGRDKWVAWLEVALAPSIRALKPGGYGFFWAIPRTAHWTAWALENAGLEIRDCHHHIFGNGAMPKSLDLMREIDMCLCSLPGRHYDKHLPPAAKRRDGDHLCPEHPRRVEAEHIRRTGLKPAVEHWILARKPLEATYSANVLKYGTGGMNVEACRIGNDKLDNHAARNVVGNAVTYGMSERGMPLDESNREAIGRWPAHLSLDEAAAVILDAQSGRLHSGAYKAGNERTRGVVFGEPSGPSFARDVEASSGGASRFFLNVVEQNLLDDPGFAYIAKPPRSEKDAGLEHLPQRTGGEATGREDDSIGVNNPRAGAGRRGGARNIHVSVKSVALMRWLIRLITPPGGVILDPFAGSGTTGVAAIQEGMRFIGCELGGDDGEYLPILEGRIKHALLSAEEPCSEDGEPDKASSSSSLSEADAGTQG